MHLIKTVFVCISIIVLTNATIVRQCPGSKARKLEDTEVKITKCTKSNCILKRGTKPEVVMKFTPTKDFKKIKHTVRAKILDVPLPFPGVDETDACAYIYSATDEKTKVGCPLKAGETYLYRNSFEVLSFYPTVSLVVHYGLSDGREDAACFEVPARIK